MRNLRTIMFRPLTMTTASDGADDGGGAGGGAGGGGEGGAVPAFYEAFTDESLKTSPSVQGFKSAEELAKGFVNLEKRFGIDPARRIDLPADPADAAGMRAVYAKLGLPEKPDGYGFALDDKATDADKAFLGRATEALHAAGLPVGMAKGVFEFWQGEAAAAATAQAAAADEARAAGEASLKQTWGQAYPQRTKEIGLLLNKYFDPAIVAELTADKLGNHPQLALGLGKLVEAMAEPGVAGGGSDEGAGGERAMTPAQATAEVRKLEGDPVTGKALRDAAHPQHKEVVKRRRELLAMTQPS